MIRNIASWLNLSHLLNRIAGWLNLSHLLNRKAIENTGLPIGAQKYEFDAWDDELQMLQMKLMQHQRSHKEELIVDLDGSVPGLSMTCSCTSNELFNYELHPLVEGHNWCHGYGVTTEQGLIFIFLHRMDIKRPEEFRFPLVYAEKGVSQKEIENVTNTFFTHLKRSICRKLNGEFRNQLETLTYI